MQFTDFSLNKRFILNIFSYNSFLIYNIRTKYIDKDIENPLLWNIYIIYLLNRS